MKQRPILFNGAMVRAILSGQKTQTRRIAKHNGDLPPEWATFAQEISSIGADGSCKPSDLFRWSEEQTEGQPLKSLRRWPGNSTDLEHDWYAIPCPYGKQGDQLWVREAFSAMGDAEMHAARIFYRADGDDGDRWTPSIHMPRWASRITLEITSVRVERLKDISEEDAKSEGIEIEPGTAHWKNYDLTPGNWRYWESPIQSFRTLWESINGAESWEANPWVWVLEFKRVEQ